MIEKLDEEEKQLKLNKTFDNQLKINIGSSLFNAETKAQIDKTGSGILKDQGAALLTEGNLVNGATGPNSISNRSSFISCPSQDSVIVARIIRAHEESTHEDRKGPSASDDVSRSSRKQSEKTDSKKVVVKRVDIDLF